MKKIILLLMSALMVACANNQGNDSGSLPDWFPDDPTLATYKSAFYGTALEETHKDLSKEDIPIRFSHLGYTLDAGGTNGICRVYIDSSGNMLARYIEIDQSFFGIAGEGQKKNLVFHEMGHCSLRRPHSNEASSDGIPLSIMWPMTLSNSLFIGRFQTYISELFANSYILNASAVQTFHTIGSSGDSRMSGATEPGEIYLLEMESKVAPNGDLVSCKETKMKLR